MKKSFALHSNRLLKPSFFYLLVPILSLLLFRSAVASAAGVHSAPCSGWHIVASPNTTSSFNVLNAVATVSSTNAWAVGYARNTFSGPYQTLIEHWDGTDWDIVSSPNPGTTNVLNSVTAISASNIWAVGSSDGKALIEHWNGSSWSIVAGPQLVANTNLNAVTAISALNIWAVGNTDDGNGNRQTFIEHWDGTDWDLISSPNAASTNNVLIAIAASSAKNIWTVGTYLTGNFVINTLIEQWNGSAWSIVSSPNPGAAGNNLKSVVALSPSNAWAVGDYVNNMSATAPTLIEHWDGSTWSVVSSPTITFESNELNSVVAFSAKNIQAIGDAFDSGGSVSLIEHWDGSTWAITPSANNTSFFNFLNGAARIPHTHTVWAVGFLTDGTGVNATTLTELSC